MCWTCVVFQQGSEFVGVPVFTSDSFFRRSSAFEKN
jgi:hypothetical protein